MDVVARRRILRTQEKMPLDRAEFLQANGELDLPFEGGVFGLALNTRAERAALERAFAEPPYKAPPLAPVLYVKSPNTLAGSGAVVHVPHGVDALSVSPTLVAVLAETACRVHPADATTPILGFAVALDFSLPQDSYFRPAVRELCRDGFLPVSPWLAPRDLIADPDAVQIDLTVNGAVRTRLDMADLHRSVARIIADVTDFMTLAPGDAVLCGQAAEPALVRIGDVVVAEAPGIGRVVCTLAPEPRP